VSARDSDPYTAAAAIMKRVLPEGVAQNREPGTPSPEPRAESREPRAESQ